MIEPILIEPKPCTMMPALRQALGLTSASLAAVPIRRVAIFPPRETNAVQRRVGSRLD